MKTFSIVAEPRAPLPNLDMWSAEARILRALNSESQPLTVGQLRARTGLAATEVQLATGRLCTARSIRRLNTVVESFCPATLD